MSEPVPFAVVNIVTITMAVGALALRLVSVRAADGRLRRNELAGIRLPSTLATDEGWLAAHKAARVPQFVGAIGLLVAAMGAFALRESSTGFLIAVLAGIAWLLVWIAVATTRARRAARTAGPGGSSGAAAVE